jgi:hypothetical protein
VTFDFDEGSVSHELANLEIATISPALPIVISIFCTIATAFLHALGRKVKKKCRKIYEKAIQQKINWVCNELTRVTINTHRSQQDVAQE